MSDVAISVRGLRKRYELGQVRGSFPTLREELPRALARIVRREGRPDGGERTLWALDGIDFDIQQGTAVGVIGHNGAGKTTLLKVLSRITPPTVGQVRMRGRCGALLEVGAGFHPELSGRENIFLNGAILGMSRREIAAKLDDIVAFAEVERFVDTPVKRYSSGMYVRLAFSVAAHLEPDILIVDEVLAVGDAAFQRRCLGKLQEVASVGRTVLVVSHNMGVIQNLTETAIWLERGRIRQTGESGEVVRDYLADAGVGPVDAARDLRDESARRAASKRGAQRVRFAEVAVVGAGGQVAGRLLEGDPLCVRLAVEAVEETGFLELIVRVRAHDGVLVFSSFSGQVEERLPVGTHRFDCVVDRCELRPGRYWLELAATSAAGVQDLVPQALDFEVVQGRFADQNPRYLDVTDGLVRVPSRWAGPL